MQYGMSSVGVSCKHLVGRQMSNQLPSLLVGALVGSIERPQAKANIGVGVRELELLVSLQQFWFSPEASGRP